MDHVNKQVDRLESIVLCQKKGKNWDGQPPTQILEYQIYTWKEQCVLFQR